MPVGNVFGHVCLSICLSVFLSVQAITFEPLDIETSFLVCRYILTICRSCLSIKVIGSRSRINLLISTCYSFVCGHRSLIRSKSHIKVKVTSRLKKNMSLPILCSPYCQQAGGLHSTEMHSCSVIYFVLCVCLKKYLNNLLF